MTGFKSFLSLGMGILLLVWGGHAHAATPAKALQAKTAQKVSLKPAPEPQVLQPAMWKVVNGKSTVYLLGSIHILPAKFNWRTPPIDEAISASDVFIFETNIDFASAEFHYFMDQHGYLPRGETLSKKLSPEARERYLALIKELRIDQDKLDYFRPGLAVFMLQQAHSAGQGGWAPGVDANLMWQAKKAGKQVGYLESLQTQFEVLAAMGGGSEMAMLEKTLLSTKEDGIKYPAMVAAWSEGDVSKLMAFDEQDANDKALLLDNRNKAWLPKIEALLQSPRTYFITVGAAHLTGKNSVIDLLCQKHRNVQRVQTGPSAPPPACPA